MGTTKTIVTCGVRSRALAVNKPSYILAFLLEKEKFLKNQFKIFKLKKLKGARSQGRE